jgi:plasmid replication initiation protein
MKKNKLIVTKSNTLIEAGYRLNLDEQRLILLAIGQIESKGTDLTNKDLFTVTAKDFSVFAGGDTRNSYRDIKKAAEDLYERSITFYERDTGSVLHTRWVSAVKYNDNSGNVELRFASDVLPLLTQIRGHFTQYNLINISNLTSIHAIRIYEFCLQYLSISKRDIELDEFKYLLGIEDQYPEFKELNRCVLKSSVAQINKHTDIIIKVNLKRKLRKVIGFTFEIKSKQARSQKSSNQKINSELKKLSESLNTDAGKKKAPGSKPSFVLGEKLFH